MSVDEVDSGRREASAYFTSSGTEGGHKCRASGSSRMGCSIAWCVHALVSNLLTLLTRNNRPCRVCRLVISTCHGPATPMAEVSKRESDGDCFRGPSASRKACRSRIPDESRSSALSNIHAAAKGRFYRFRELRDIALGCRSRSGSR
jgi:hypothetical protein